MRNYFLKLGVVIGILCMGGFSFEAHAEQNLWCFSVQGQSQMECGPTPNNWRTLGACEAGRQSFIEQNPTRAVSICRQIIGGETPSPTPQPTPGPTPNPSPNPSPTPSPSPSPTPSPNPSPSPSPSPSPAPTPPPASSRGTFKGLIEYFVYLMNRLVAILLGVAFLAFIYSLIQYLGKGGDAKDKSDLKSRITAGLLGMFVIVTVWGLIRFIGGIFGIL